MSRVFPRKRLKGQGGERGKSPRRQPRASPLQPHRKPAPSRVLNWGGGGERRAAAAGSGGRAAPGAPGPGLPAGSAGSGGRTKQTASPRGRPRGEVPTPCPPCRPFLFPAPGRGVKLLPSRRRRCRRNAGNRSSGRESGSIKEQLRLAKGWVPREGLPPLPGPPAAAPGERRGDGFAVLSLRRSGRQRLPAACGKQAIEWRPRKPGVFLPALVMQPDDFLLACGGSPPNPRKSLFPRGSCPARGRALSPPPTARDRKELPLARGRRRPALGRSARGSKHPVPPSPDLLGARRSPEAAASPGGPTARRGRLAALRGPPARARPTPPAPPRLSQPFVSL